MKIQADKVQVKAGRRELNVAHVKELAESIRELGLLNPITVDKDYILIAGLHRLEAVKSLGWLEVESTVSSLEGLQAELAEIDENFVRNDLSVLELGEMLLRRKEIYEMLHPESKNGGDRKSEEIRAKKVRSDSAKSFVQDTAEKLGVVPRTVELQIQTAKNLTPAAKEIIKGSDTKITRKSALQLSRLEPEQQQEAAVLLAAKEIKSVDEFTAAKTPASEPLAAEQEKEIPEPINMEEDRPILEKIVFAVPYSLPKEHFATLKESIADLKNPHKDCSCTPDLFLAEYTSFINKFNNEINWYDDSQYNAACAGLSHEQMLYLRQLTDSVCAAAENLYRKLKGKNQNELQKEA